MNGTSQIARAVIAPDVAPRRPAPLARGEAPGLARRIAGRLGNEWLPRAAWTVSRTGRPGLVGMALLLAATVFLLSTHLRIVAEVQALRADLATAQLQSPPTAGGPVSASSTTLRQLPVRDDMPSILRQLFQEASRAGLAVDTARYELKALASSGVVRYQIALPVTGPYPKIRAFIDATLATMPEVALSDLQLARKTIADGSVEAQLRFTIYARSAP